RVPLVVGGLGPRLHPTCSSQVSQASGAGVTAPKEGPEGGGGEAGGANATCWENAPPPPPPPVLESLISWQPGFGTSADTKVFIAKGSSAAPGPRLSTLPPQLQLPVPRDQLRFLGPPRLPSCRVAQDFNPFTRGMACTPTRNEENKGSGLSQAATSLGGGPVSLSRSEELLTRISTELTNEALFIAGYHMNPVPTKGKQTQDRGTQISNHVFFTKTRGTDTHSDRNRTRTKAHLLPSPCDKGTLPSSLTSGR
uniref:Uncharacterized protein n=2 Tax=Equus TaxID=9789 RepID=A0A9L0T4W4_HORSE